MGSILSVKSPNYTYGECDFRLGGGRKEHAAAGRMHVSLFLRPGMLSLPEVASFPVVISLPGHYFALSAGLHLAMPLP